MFTSVARPTPPGYRAARRVTSAQVPESKMRLPVMSDHRHLAAIIDMPEF
jgi:hypothetical protein